MPETFVPKGNQSFISASKPEEECEPTGELCSFCGENIVRIKGKIGKSCEGCGRMPLTFFIF